MNSRALFRDFIEQVRQRTDIVDLIGRDVELRPSGSCLKGLSPFHAERTPSFVVWPATQTWRDFSNGGGLGGDAFTYVMQRAGCGFKEALFDLAERAGVKRPGQSDEEFREELALLEERREIERLFGVAASYYHRVLPADVRDRWYRQQYGFTHATIDRLQLGWADGGLFRHFTKDLGIAPDLALKTGLFVQIPGGVTDFFYKRLVLPYWKQERPAYFIGRKTDQTPDQPWEAGKYKKLLTHSERHPYVSPTVRNDVFYGEDAVVGAERILITEGITDAIAAQQAGIATLSPVTTQFRTKDVPKLLALTERVKRIVICNDAEESGAGDDGALATARLFHRSGRDVRLAKLPRPEGVEKVDVNEFLKDHSAEAFQTVIDAARRYADVLIDDIPSHPDPRDLDELLEPVLEALVTVSPLDRDFYLGHLCERFHIKRRPLTGMYKAAEARVRREERNEHDDEAPTFRGEVYEEDGYYYAPRREGGVEAISSFVIEPTARLTTERDRFIVANLKTTRGLVLPDVMFASSAFHSKRELLRALPSPDVHWTGTDDQVQGVLKRISGVTVPHRRGTHHLGYQETEAGPRWTAPDVVITPDGFADANELVYVPNGTKLASKLKYTPAAPDDVRRLGRAVLPSLLDLNTSAVTLPIIGWFFATPFRPRIVRLRGHFPILLVWGTQGSGKTSLIVGVFWPLFGVAHEVEPFSATETEFALIRLFSSTESVPVFLDEYKPRDMTKQQVDRLHRYLRRIYGGETEDRGRRDLTLESYRLSAPVCIAGESPPDGDPALRERIISVSPNKNYLEAHPECRATFDRLRSLPLAHFAAPYIQFALGCDTARDLDEARAVTDDLLAEVAQGLSVPVRVRDNLEVMVFGVRMFQRFASHVGVELPETDLAPAASACIASVTDGERAGKDAFDEFMEALSVYALNEELKPNTHFALINGQLRIHLQSCYEVYRSERRRAGADDNTNGIQALRRIAREKCERGGYIRSVEGPRAKLGGGYLRAIEIELRLVPPSMDLDGFLTATSRAGGEQFTPDYREASA